MIAIDFGQIYSFNKYLLEFNIDDLCVYIFKKLNRSAINKFDILHAITHYKIPKTIKFAIESGANITMTGYSNEGALHLAAAHELKEIAELLISNGIDINAKDKNGKTPLHYAAKKSLEMVKFLISHGADINATTNQKETALHYAAKKSLEMVEFLVSHGADINATTYLNKTALYFAQYYDKNDIVEFLISHSAKEKSGEQEEDEEDGKSMSSSYSFSYL